MSSKLRLSIIGGLICLSNISHAQLKTDSLVLGIKMYDSSCKVCHAPNKAVPMHAPAAFNKNVWLKRFNTAEKIIKSNYKFKTISDYMLYQVKIGKGLMHHGGLCEESKLVTTTLNCSNAAYLQAIQYMAQIRFDNYKKANQKSLKK